MTREEILSTVDTYAIVEEYPDDKYLPSYLILAEDFHILFAVDTAGNDLRVVTAYRPDPDEWEPGFTRRKR
jgi:hypothetical protein